LPGSGIIDRSYRVLVLSFLSFFTSPVILLGLGGIHEIFFSQLPAVYSTLLDLFSEHMNDFSLALWYPLPDATTLYGTIPNATTAVMTWDTASAAHRPYLEMMVERLGHV
jgi:hypothetical protein